MYIRIVYGRLINVFFWLYLFFFLGRDIKVGVLFTGLSFGGGCVSDRGYDDSYADYVGDEGIRMMILWIDVPMGKFEVETD